MIQPFMFRMQTAVNFGCGKVDLIGEQVKEFGLKKVLVISDEGIRKAGLLDKVISPLEAAGMQLRVFTDVEPDPCLETIHKAADFYRLDPADALVAVGGGSPMDTAKGCRVVVENGGHIRDYVGSNRISKKPQIPLFCIPTTAGSGSETTIFAVLGDTERNIKVTVASPYLAPDMTIIDPLMMVSASPSITAGAGIDALAHAVEAYVSPLAEPITDAWALAAIELIANSLNAAVHNGNNIEARTGMAMASNFASMAFCNAKLGIAHSLGVPLSGLFHVNHGVTIGLFLPVSMEYNMLANLPKFKRIAAAMGVYTHEMSEREASLAGCNAVGQLVEDIGLPRHFSQMGLNVTDADAQTMAHGAINHGMTATNPRKPTEKELYQLYLKCF